MCEASRRFSPENEACAQASRAYFPRGLMQPEGSFRFSMDALLLAAFIRPGPTASRLLDLGTGCGVVALAMLCRYPNLQVTGVDVQAPLLQAAQTNAALLGFSGQFTAMQTDLAAYAGISFPRNSETTHQAPLIEPASFDVVLANPPYRKRGHGRLPPNLSRCQALFEEDHTLASFCNAAGYALAPHGTAGMVFPAARQTDLLSALRAAGLTPYHIIPVHSRAEEPPLLVLTAAGIQVHGKAQISSAAVQYNENNPLILHQGKGNETRLTEAAITFCPWFACNQKT